MNCSIQDCERNHFARTWCRLHYDRWYHNGDPLRTRRNLQLGECGVDGCTEPKSAKGYCRSHYGQWKRNPASVGTPIKRSYPANTRDENGRKHCGACNQWLAIANFANTTARPDGLRVTCRQCDSISYNARREHVRDRRLKTQFNITRAEWDEMFENQGQRCAICRASEPGGNGWATDHDHDCCSGRDYSCGTCIRGILCSTCNTGIGLLRDNPETLRRAAEYVEAAKSQPSR